MKLSEFDFELPSHLIAKHPLYPRGSSRLLCANSQKEIFDYCFDDIVNLFKKDDLLILNNSKVIPAYFTATLDVNGSYKKIVVYLNKYLGKSSWQIFARPGKLLKEGQKLFLNKDLFGLVKRGGDYDMDVILEFDCDEKELFKKILSMGKMPIPPYLKREPENSDNEDYQTIFAKHYGSVAAPTAGLHFNAEMLDKIQKKGVKLCYVTLHVGSGTFLPVKSENINDHNMHYERFSISKESAEMINNQKKEGKRVVCVGSTSLRAVESIASPDMMVKEVDLEETNIFIKPGYKFKIVDSLITNFHTPKSTLFMLICAFSGVEFIKDVYKHAIENDYRFFSYGDVSWLDNKS
jgi:S-adenosylmethionine:tRNA ribosyltransferase-isomerase